VVAPREPLTDYLAVEGGRLRSIDQILARSSADLGRQIRALKVVDEETAMTRIQLKAQQSAIKAHLDQDWKDIAKATDAGQRDAVEAASRTISKYENEMWSMAGVPQADLKDMADMEAKRAARSVRTMMDREQTSHRPLAGSVYRSKAVASGMVDNAVNSALARGLSVDQFASEIERLVNPLQPGGVSYVARRLARTEINNAYHAGSLRRYDESGMVDAVEWHKSKSHPEGDECDDLEANSPYDADKVPDKPHPQCLCFITPALPSQEDFIKNVLSDKYGRQKSFIQEVAPEAITAAALGTIALRVAPYAIRYAKRRILKSSLQKGPKIALKALNSSASREEVGDAITAARAAARKAQRDQLEELVRQAAETGQDIRDIAQQIKPVEIPKAPTPNAGALKPGAIVTDIRDRFPAGKIAANDLAKDSGNALKGPRKAPVNPLAPKVIEDHGSMDGVDLAKFRQARPEDFEAIPDMNDARQIALEHYTSGVSYDISDALRAGKIPGPDPIDSSVYEEMMKIVTSTRTTEDLILTRGIDVMDYTDFMPNVGPNKASWIGEVLEDKAFLSTSADDVPVWGNFELKIHVPKGSRGAYIDQYSMTPGQYEFVMPPDTKLKVIGVRDVKYSKKQLGQPYFEERENPLEKTILDVIAITDDEALEIAAKRRATPMAKAAAKVEGPNHLKVLNAAEYGTAQEKLDAVNLVKELNPKAYAKIPEASLAKLIRQAADGEYPSHNPEVRSAIEAGKRAAKAAIKKEADAAKALLAVADDASPAAIKAASKAPIAKAPAKTIEPKTKPSAGIEVKKKFRYATEDDVPRPDLPRLTMDKGVLSGEASDAQKAIWSYTGNSKGINKKLRDIDTGVAKTGLNKAQRKLHDDLLEIVNSGQTYSDLTFVRGVYAPAIKDILDAAEGDITKAVGMTMRDGAFLSTSVGEDAIWGPYQLNIMAPKGTRGIYVSDGHSLVGNQREFLMPPGSNMKITNVEVGSVVVDGRKTKKTYIDVVLVQDKISPADR
jgi:hypothetical protein